MQLKTLLLGFILGLFSFTTMAGSDHNHGHSHEPVNQNTAIIKATQKVASLVKQNKLDQSWASIKASSIEQKTFKGKQEWVVTFVNDNIVDTKKQKLYVFLTLGGDYIAANFTGK